MRTRPALLKDSPSLRSGVLALALVLPLPRQAAAMAAYGRDNRKDIHELPAAGLRELSRSVAALFKSAKVSSDGETATLATVPLLEHLPFHPSERFARQPTGAHCAGALVAPDRLWTAGHCFRATSCADTSFVFDYAIDEPGRDPTKVPASSVYGCGELLARRDTPDEDWALVRLDRPVAGRKPLEVEPEDPRPGDAVFTIGFPFGLPAKYAGSATVRGTAAVGFSSDLDAFGGNSGGPVFDHRTRKLVGLVSRGDGFVVQDLEHPGLVTIMTLGKGAGAGTQFTGSPAVARGAAAQRRAALLGRGEVERLQARLEALARELP